jgi:tRNA threonylcarbamoyladenosine biosynthesis protein TsaB
MKSHVALVLEASTPHASVAVFVEGELAGEASAEMRPGADELLMPAVDEALRAAGVRPAVLDTVVCGAGPGGFTSLRIAAAIAKGLAHATGCRLEAVPSLALAAAARGPGRWIVTMDALRGERYAAQVTVDTVGFAFEYAYLGVLGADALTQALVHADTGPWRTALVDANAQPPRARALESCNQLRAEVPLETWEPLYGRQAEAQARWELAHGRPLATAVAPDPGL